MTQAIASAQCIAWIAAAAGFAAWAGRRGLCLQTLGPTLLACLSGLALCGLARTAHLGFAGDVPGILLPLALTVWLLKRMKGLAVGTGATLPAPLSALLATALASACVDWFLSFQRAPDGGWDAWMIWNLRARFLAGTDFDLAAALPPALAHADFGSHLDYPLLLPLALAELSLGFGQHAAIAALVSAAGALAVIACAWRVAAHLLDERAAAAVCLALSCTPAFVLAGAAQYADLWLAGFVLLGAEGLARGVSALEDPLGAAPQASEPWLIAGGALSLAACVKQEGLLWVVAGVVALASVLPAGRRLRPLAILVAGASPLLLLLGWFKTSLAPPSDLAQPLGVVLAHVFDGSRWLELVAGLSRRVVYFQAWGLWLAAFAIAAAWSARRTTSPRTRVLGRLLGLVAAGELLVYLVTPHDLGWHLRTSLDRLVLQAWPLALVWLGSRVMPAPASEAPPAEPQRSAG